MRSAVTRLTPKLLSTTLTRRPLPRPKTLSTSDHYFSDGLHDIRESLLLSTEKPAPPSLHVVPDDLRPKIAALAEDLMGLGEEWEEAVERRLESGGAVGLIERCPDGSAFVELLGRIVGKPGIALEVVGWRRKQAETGKYPMEIEEYTKAITIAGRARNVEAAGKLFSDAVADGARTTATYNALMAVYMYNGITKKTMSVFEDLKRDKSCNPSIVTYNILLSVFGRLVLVEHMETILGVIKESKLVPNISTYNTLIAGYLTAWMWDKMENTFNEMEEGPVKPDTNTYLLMLRGFAHSGNLEKMEEIYELVKEEVNNQKVMLIRAMVCAYCKSSDLERVGKIEELLTFIPEEEYRSWFHVILIRLYAQEGLVDKMEKLILEAFNRSTVIFSVSVMRSIITGYFRCDAVDRLAHFIRSAELAGWRLCRSLYHCKLVMYGKHQRFMEMQHVLDEMASFRFTPCQKTYLILYKAYCSGGKIPEADSIFGLMWKHGYNVPVNA